MFCDAHLHGFFITTIEGRECVIATTGIGIKCNSQFQNLVVFVRSFGKRLSGKFDCVIDVARHINAISNRISPQDMLIASSPK